jgi:hypothetical protein
MLNGGACHHNKMDNVDQIHKFFSLKEISIRERYRYVTHSAVLSDWRLRAYTHATHAHTFARQTRHCNLKIESKCFKMYLFSSSGVLPMITIYDMDNLEGVSPTGPADIQSMTTNKKRNQFYLQTALFIERRIWTNTINLIKD